MKKKILTATILSSIILGATTYIASATNLNLSLYSGIGGEGLYTIEKTEYLKSINGSVLNNNPELNKENPYFMFKNVWGGDSLKILFDKNTMKINGIAKSGDLSNSNDNFSFKIIDNESKEALINESANSIKVTDFISKINGKEFKYGDIVELNVKSSSGLKSPSLYSEEKVLGTNCINKDQYFKITEKGLENYVPNINVSPIEILGQEMLRNITITGTSDPNLNILVLVEGKEFLTTSNENGEFTVDIESEAGFTAHTAIEVRVGEVESIVYPQLSSEKNMKQETNTGYSYTLNADLETLTTAFESNILYGRTLLSEDGKKAWDIAYKALLKYENIEDKYPRDSAGNVQFYVDYESHGIKITSKDAQYIQNYLIKNEPRMFLLKDWSASPVSKDGVIIGQNFYIGNSAQNGDDYQRQLLETEEQVSKILSKITADMSVYQIIKVLQVEYEAAVSYRNAGTPGDMRGAFTFKQAICGGYSKGFEYLLQRVGIENIWVTGQAGGYHAWNHINLYGNWYLADTTWGGKNWYMKSWEDSKNHVVDNAWNITPELAKESIPWELGDRGQTIGNLTGIVNYENNNDGTIKVTYEDTENINKKMQINTSINEYKPVDMIKDNKGMWSATISYEEENLDTVDFFFTVDGKFNTLGNVKANNLKVENFENGMKNIVLATLNVSKEDLKELINKSNYKEEDYTKISFAKYTEALEKANKVLTNDKASSVEISATYKEVQNAINTLEKVNKIEFKGYNNVVFMTLGFDTEKNEFKAVSNGEMVHPYQYSKVYAKVEHF
ncbi:MAG: transglutaminase domain-containing protein, partial [Clostridium sp.]